MKVMRLISVVIFWRSTSTTQAKRLLFGAGCIASIGVEAATYYVMTSGSDSVTCSAAMNEQTPKRTIAGGISCLTPGSTLLIGRGTYPSFVVRQLDGTPSAPITIKALGDGKVTVDRHLGGPGGTRAIEFFASRYITIDGLAITDSDPLIDLHRSCDVVNNTWACVLLWREHFLGRVGVKLSPKLPSTGLYLYPDHITLTNLEIHHLAAGPIGGKANNVEIKNNHIHNNGAIASASGMYVYGDRFVIRGNRVHDNNSDGIRMGSDAAGNEITNSIIENNVCFNHDRTHIQYADKPNYVVRFAGEGIIAWRGHSNIIRNNVVYGNRSWGIRVNGVPPYNNRVYNNTVYNNGRQGIYVHADETNDIRNNISFGNHGSGSYAGDLFIGAGNTASHNLTSDPRFVDAAKGNFRLQANSTLAIDRGMTLPAVLADFAGVRRQAGAYDIGAFEYVGAMRRPPRPAGLLVR